MNFNRIVFLVVLILAVYSDARAQLRAFDNSRTTAPWIYNPAVSFTGDFQTLLAYDGRNNNSFTPQSLFAAIRIPVIYPGRDRRKPASMVGAQFLRTTQDIVSSSVLSGNFSYQVPMSKRMRAAVGLGAGMAMLNYNYENLNFIDQQDPLLGNGVDFFTMHLNAGVSLVFDERFTLAAALPYILRENKVNLGEYVIRAMYDVHLTHDLELLVAANLDTYNRTTAVGGDFRVQWKKTIGVLAGADNVKAFTGVTMRFETIVFNYTYGLNYSELLNRLPTNQVMVMLSIPPKSKYSK